MSKLYDLNELVPGIEDVTIKYRDETYVIPGDLNTERTFEFMALYDEILEFQRAAAEAVASQDEKKALEVKDELERLMGTIGAKVLDVLKIRHPDVKELPFGQQSLMAVVGIILEAMGIGRSAGATDGPPPPAPTPLKPRRRSTTRRSTKRAGATKRKTAPRKR